MAACALIGDSIAVGLAAALKVAGYSCTVTAHVGASSADLPVQLARVASPPSAIVSTGTNDARGARPDASLVRARTMLGRARVVWLLPYRRNAAYAITQVAFRFGDEIVDLAALPSRDHIHPASYRALAAMLPR